MGQLCGSWRAEDKTQQSCPEGVCTLQATDKDAGLWTRLGSLLYIYNWETSGSPLGILWLKIMFVELE